MVVYKSQEDIIAELQKRSIAGYISLFDFDPELYRAMAKFFPGKQLQQVIRIAHLEYRRHNRGQLTDALKKIWLKEKGETPLSWRGIEEVAPHLLNSLQAYFTSIVDIANMAGLKHSLKYGYIAKGRPTKYTAQDKNFKEVCRLLIERFGLGKSKIFTTREFRHLIAKQRLSANKLLSIMEEDQIVQRSRFSVWEINTDAIERYKKKEFHPND